MSRAKPGDPPYPKIIHGIHGHLSRLEAKFLIETPARLGPGLYGELGTYRGKSTICVAAGIKNDNVDAHLITVDGWDLPGGPGNREIKYCRDEYDNVRQEIDSRGVGDHVTMVKGFTVPTAELYKDREFTFIFIDADHAYEGVKGDFEAWSPMVKSGGEIAFHDTQLDSVQKALDEIPWETYLVDSITVKVKP